MEEKHLNVKKVITTISIIAFAFLIILISAVFTSRRLNCGTDVANATAIPLHPFTIFQYPIEGNTEGISSVSS